MSGERGAEAAAVAAALSAQLEPPLVALSAGSNLVPDRAGGAESKRRAAGGWRRAQTHRLIASWRPARRACCSSSSSSSSSTFCAQNRKARTIVCALYRNALTLFRLLNLLRRRTRPLSLYRQDWARTKPRACCAFLQLVRKTLPAKQRKLQPTCRRATSSSSLRTSSVER